MSETAGRRGDFFDSHCSVESERVIKLASVTRVAYVQVYCVMMQNGDCSVVIILFGGARR